MEMKDWSIDSFYARVQSLRPLYRTVRKLLPFYTSIYLYESIVYLTYKHYAKKKWTCC